MAKVIETYTPKFRTAQGRVEPRCMSRQQPCLIGRQDVVSERLPVECLMLLGKLFDPSGRVALRPVVLDGKTQDSAKLNMW